MVFSSSTLMVLFFSMFSSAAFLFNKEEFRSFSVLGLFAGFF